MSEPYYRVNPYADPRPEIDWDETYDMLRGPNGFECLLTEPEDRTWCRDGKAAVKRLNELQQQIERLTAELADADADATDTREQLNVAREEIVRLRAENNKQDEMLATKQVQLHNAKKEIKQLEAERADSLALCLAAEEWAAGNIDNRQLQLQIDTYRSEEVSEG